VPSLPGLGSFIPRLPPDLRPGLIYVAASRLDFRWQTEQKEKATTYFPTHFRVQYHRPCGAQVLCGMGRNSARAGAVHRKNRFLLSRFARASE